MAEEEQAMQMVTQADQEGLIAWLDQGLSPSLGPVLGLAAAVVLFWSLELKALGSVALVVQDKLPQMQTSNDPVVVGVLQMALLSCCLSAVIAWWLIA